MTTFLEYFDIPLDQVQGEFLNLDLDRDTKLFIDSYYLTWSKNIYCINALETQKVFMSELMLSLKEGKDRRTNELCAHFKEPKCTGIGLSAASYDGRGSKEIKVQKIINALKKSKAAQTGLLEDLEELILVTRDIGADTISDITTNICMKHFAEYTLEQCEKLNIPVEETKQYFFYFCSIDKIWKKEKFKLPHVPLGKNEVKSPIVLLPTDILDDLISYNSSYFFTSIASPIFAKEALQRFPLASFIYAVKSTGERKVNLTDIRNLYPEYRGNKENMDKIITENPNLLKDYRNTVAYKRYKDRMLKDEK
ncbi:hypothetical protein [Acinetobacter terrestris]|uniref:hypothetical protein n=1 Tax=Acinetobacter terrestris TaxID=2529843 RepID=UPI00103EB35E|nr:hypothetical protein [Acinetobacter terrestris]TCB49743.1 hypothetical protein E0H84_15650 [Acinetobacter terrestris]